LLFRLRAVDETELLSDLGTALPDARTERDPAKELAGDDLAALFGLDMADSEVPATPPSAQVASPGPRRKSVKNVVAKPAFAVTTSAATKAKPAKPPQKSKVAPTGTAPEKTVAAPAESKSKPATVTSTTAGRKAPARAPSS